MLMQAFNIPLHRPAVFIAVGGKEELVVLLLAEKEPGSFMGHAI